MYWGKGGEANVLTAWDGGKKAPSIINGHQLRRETDVMCTDGRTDA